MVRQHGLPYHNDHLVLTLKKQFFQGELLGISVILSVRNVVLLCRVILRKLVFEESTVEDSSLLFKLTQYIFNNTGTH